MSDNSSIRAMLFADVVGFSKLPGAAYRRFMEFISGGAAKILLSHDAQVPNTWGTRSLPSLRANAPPHALLALQTWLRRTPGTAGPRCRTKSPAPQTHR